MALTDKQRKFLRGLAHAMQPCVTVGSAGLTAGLLAEFDEQLNHHELIKVKVRVGDRRLRDATVRELGEQSGAECITRIGNVAVFFRQRADDPGIRLP